ncbi:MAG: C40 family peptidase [Saprospirales bacterium]|nr:C40 family peptidase [Saprospirales bacterium]MBK6904614.1 C40 family peptidase [Saprospirales bacterium]
MHLICPFSVIPVRSSPQERGEQLTQLLFGDLMEVLDRQGKNWLRVRCIPDNTVGWVQSNQVLEITPSEFHLYKGHFAYCLDLLHPVMAENAYIPVSLGARLPNFDGMQFQLAGKAFTFSGLAVFPADLRPASSMVLKIAQRFLFAPEQAGGRSPLGVDCSGLTQLVFGIVGIPLGREPELQVLQGETVDFVEESQPGDLAFFEDRKGRVNHVGIVLPNRQIMHVHGSVRIDKLDHFGIYDEQAQHYSHKMRVIRRVLPPEALQSENTSQQAEVVRNQIELFTPHPTSPE